MTDSRVLAEFLPEYFDHTSARAPARAQGMSLEWATFDKLHGVSQQQFLEENYLHVPVAICRDLGGFRPEGSGKYLVLVLNHLLSWGIAESLKCLLTRACRCRRPM